MVGFPIMKDERSVKKQVGLRIDEVARGVPMLWRIFVVIAGGGFGLWATRSFWHSVSPNDRIWAGFVALFVFLFAASAGATVLRLSGRAMGNAGRFGLAGLTAALLWFALVVPMRHEAALAREKAEAAGAAADQANLRQLQAQMRDTPHAPPGTVPGMLGVERDGNGVGVTNLADRPLSIRVALVLPHGDRIERCSLGAAVTECTPGGSDCSYSLGRDGTPIRAPVREYEHQPYIAPGHAKKFLSLGCGERFGAAALEFEVWDRGTDTYLFRSDSRFMLDYRPAER